MPQQVEVDGVGTVEFPDGMSQDAILGVLRDKFPPKEEKVSPLQAAGTGFLSGLIPAGAGAAAAAPTIPWAVGAAPATYGASLLVPPAVGLVGSFLAGAAQKKVIHEALPGVEKYQAEAQEQHPRWTGAGSVAAAAPFFKVGLPGSLKSLATGVGLQEGITAGQTLATEHRLPTTQEALEAAAMGTLFHEPRGPLLPRAKLAAIAAARAQLAKPPAPAEPAKAPEPAPEPEKGVPNAPQERQIESGLQGQRQRTYTLRPPPEAGPGDSLQPAAEGQTPVPPEQAGVLLGQKPSFSERVEARVKAQQSAFQARADALMKQHAQEHPERPVVTESLEPEAEEIEPGGVELEQTQGKPQAPAEGDPFANRQVAVARHATGQIVVDPEALNESLRRLEPLGPEAQENWFKSVMAHEANHLATSGEDAQRYAQTLTAAEKALERRLYTGKWGTKAQLTDRLLGWEAVRRRMSRLEGMTTDEVAAAVGKEKWKLQGLEVLNDTIRNIRETLGTKASKEGLAILDKVQRNLDTAIAVASGKAPAPGANMPADREAPEVAVLSQGSGLRNQFGHAAGTSYHATPKDWATWQDIQGRYRQAAQALDWDRIMEVGREHEAMKNKYGGMPPAKPKEHPAAQMPPDPDAEARVAAEKLKALAAKYRQDGDTETAQMLEGEIAKIRQHFPGMDEQSFPAARVPRRPELGQETLPLAKVLRGTPRDRGVNIEVPEEARRLKISPAEIDWSQPGEIGAYRPISEAESTNAKAVAELLKDHARTGGSDLPVSSSRRMLVMVDRKNGEVHIVSAYPEGRSGVRVVNPAQAGAARPTRPIAELLNRYKPLYSILRDSPVKNFHQKFADLDDYQQRFGDEASQKSQESIGGEYSGAAEHGTIRSPLRGSSEYSYQGGGKQALPETPGETPKGIPSTADLKAFHDFFEGEIPPTKHDFDIRLRGAVAKGSRQMANAVYQAFLAEEKASPQTSPEVNVERALEKLYEDLRKSETRTSFIEEASKRYGASLAQPVQERGLGAAKQVNQPGVLREITSPERGPIPGGSPLVRFPQKFPPAPAPTLSPEAQRFVAGQAESRFPTLGRGFATPHIAAPAGPPTGAPPLGPGWPLRENVVGKRLPTGTVPPGYKETRPTLKLEGEEPGAMMPRLIREAQDLKEQAGHALSLLVARHRAVQDTAVILDSADHAAGNQANQLEQRIRLNSMQRPEGLKAFTTPWNRGKEIVLHAANAVAESNFDRREAETYLGKIQNGRAKAEDLLKTGTLRERQIARGWLRDLDISQREVQYALDHWNDHELQMTAKDAARGMAEIIRMEKDAGIEVNKQPGYLGHRYIDIWKSFDTLFNKGIIGKKYKEARSFKTHYDALEAGPFMRVTHDIASLAAHRYLQGMRGILREQWKDSLLGMKSPEGTPLAIRAEQAAGGGLISPDPRYQRLGNTGLAVLKDYHSGLNNLFSENVIEEFTPTRNLLYFSQAIKHTLLAGDFFHLGRMLYYGTSILGKNMGYKAGRSVLDLADKDMGEAVTKGLIRQKDVDWARERVIPYRGKTISRRELIEKFYREMGANLGTIQDALYKDLVTNISPMSGPVRTALHTVVDPSLGRYNRFLFDNLTRGLMAESVAREYERQHAILTKRGTAFSEDTLMRDIARDVNNFYGNIGRQGILKAKWQQDLARMLFLAPNWVEGLIRKEASATSRLTGLSKVTGAREGLTGIGTTGMAIGRGLVFMAGLTQAINLITRKQFTWQNEEEGHKLDAWIPRFGSDKDGFWLSPLAIYNEVTHDLYRLSETKPTFADVLTQIAGNKEQPITRAVIIMGTGKTPTGETTTTTAGRLKSAAGAAVPVPITFGRYAQAAGHALAPNQVSAVPAGAMQRQAFGTFGVKIEPAAGALGNMTQLAKKFMDREHLSKTSGWSQIQTDEVSYSKLRAALKNDDTQKAARLLEELRKANHTDKDIMRSMQQWAKKGFTGSRQTERLFIASLSEKQLEQYAQALDERMGTLEKFYQFYAGQP